MDRKKIYLVWGILVLLVMIAGSYAYFSWRTSESRLVLTVGDINNIQVVLKPYRIDTDILPVLTYENEDYVSVDVVNSNNKRNTFELYYKINTIDEELKNSNFKYTITKSTDGGNTYSEVKTDTFSSANDDTEITIYSSIISGIKTEKYKVYVWLDGSDEGQTNVEGKTFNAELRALFIPADDIVVDVPTGLIPVVFDTSDDTVVKTILQDDVDWYDYSSQEWANAVLVKESGTQTRAYYKANTGVKINKDDILGYYTYVPRYKYKIWTTELSATGNEQTIDIVFESANVKKSTGTTVGTYITHPAFTFGDIELNGIWVGKFETTGIADEPTVLPDVSSLRNQNVSTQFQTALKFSGGSLLDSGNVSISGNSTYGLTTNANSHMMKNSEWGAVAYLSHSKYGVNREIYINNSSLRYTGRSGGNVGGSTPINETYTDQSATDLYNEYGYYTWDGYLLDYNTDTKSSVRDLTKAASTTGNITGIYDMSGGALEHVMGVFANSDGQLWSGGGTYAPSGFTGLIGEAGTSYTGVPFPDSKYYDVYKASSGITINELTACNGGICYGHGLSEVSGWYEDYAFFLGADNPWLNRGGRFANDYGAGIFGFYYIGGYAVVGGSFRSVIVYDPTGKIITAPTVTIGTNGNSGYVSGSISSTITVSKGSAELDASSLKYIYSTSSTDTPNTSFTSGSSYTLTSGNGIYYLIARACDVDGECTKVVSKPFYVDNTAPVITLSKETYQEGFDNWTMPTGGSVSNGVLTLSQSGVASSNLYMINGERWRVTYDAYTETSATSYSSSSDDSSTGDGGVHGNASYYDASKNSIKAQNGNAHRLSLNTWSNDITWDCSDCYGTDVKYLRFSFTTGNSYSQPPVKIRNFKLWGQLYSNSFYNINISKSDNNGIKTTKYASGNQTASYFASNGTVVTDNVIRVTDNNTYTVYVEDVVGNKNVSTITIDKIDKVAPTGTISASFSSGTLKGTVSASDNLSGISLYMYALTTSTTCPTSGYTESTNNSYSFTLSSVGTYYICTKIKDVAGNTSDAIRSSAYVYGDPTITLGTNGNSGYVNGNISSKITVTKGGANLDTSTFKYIYSTSNTATPNTSFTSGSSYTLTSGNGIYYLIAKACDVYSKCTTIVSKPFYVDNTAPTLSLTKETYQEGFTGWTMPTGGSVSNNILTLSQSGTATSNYYAVNGEYWHVSYDGYTTGDLGTGAGGIHSGSSYFDSSKNSVKAPNGYTGNGKAYNLSLNTWSNNITWTCSDCYGTDIKYLTLRFITGNTYSQPSIKIRNFKVWGQLYSNSFYNINVSKSDNNGIKTTKYASGSQTESYFASNGTVVSGDVIKVTANNTYTVYVEDVAGNKKISTITIDKIDKTAPTGTVAIALSSGKLVGTVSASDNLSGVSSYMYALSTSSTCPTSGYTESTSKTHSFSVSNAGTYYICTKIKDVAGNTSSAIRSSAYKYTAPTITLGTNGNSAYVKGNVSSKITVTKGSADLSTSTYKYIFSTSNSATPSTSFTSGSSYTLTSGNGKYYLIAKACDTNNVCTTKVSNIFYVDNTAPTCSLSVSGTTITGKYSDTGGSGVAYYGYSSGMTGTSSATKTISATGTHTFYVKDGAGNSKSCSLSVVATTSSTDCSSWGSYYCTSWGKYYCKSSTGNACGNQSCCAREGGTWTRDCNKYGRDCNQYTTTYSCASGYTKASNSYCYKIN